LDHLNALVQAEKRQDGYDDYDCADDVDDAVHGIYLRIGQKIEISANNESLHSSPYSTLPISSVRYASAHSIRQSVRHPHRSHLGNRYFMLGRLISDNQ
jgi:hypothetical protein